MIASLILALSTMSSLAVISAAPRGGTPPAMTAPLSQALTEQGVTTVSGAALKRALLPTEPPATSVSRESETLIQSLERQYDSGEFASLVSRGDRAIAALEKEAPGERREMLLREAELLCGAALLQSKKKAAAIPYFERAVVLDPSVIADPYRFSPPVRDFLNLVRADMSRRKKVVLSVAGNGETLFVDGLPRGVLPTHVELFPHRAMLWVDRDGVSGPVHEVDLGAEGEATFSLPIDAGLETSITDRDGEVELVFSGLEAERRVLVRGVAARSDANGVIVVEQLAGQSPERAGDIALTHFDASGDVVKRVIVPLARSNAPIDWVRVARILLEPTGTVAPVGTLGSARTNGLAVSTDALPALQTERPAASKAVFPWLPVSLAVGGVAVVAVILTVALSAHGSNAVLTGPTQANP